MGGKGGVGSEGREGPWLGEGHPAMRRGLKRGNGCVVTPAQ
jgi:hypothetical protein